MRELQLEGVRLFNAHEFYEAHEAWEEVWRHSQGDDAIFWQALIQAAAALLHWGNANRHGAGRLAASALEKLASLNGSNPPQVYLGIELERFLREFSLVVRPLIAWVQESRSMGMAFSEVKPDGPVLELANAPKLAVIIDG